MRGIRTSLRQLIAGIWSLLRNPYWWGGLVVLVLVLGACHALLNRVIMPKATRQGVTVQLPNIINQPAERAQVDLTMLGFNVERIEQPYNSDFPPDVVIDQRPSPNATVKPGRHVYVTVNSGRRERVVIPKVEGFSLREAENRLRARDLLVGETLPDSIPAPHPNTVTRQEPPPGDSLWKGSSVSLWYSTGLGQSYSTIPDVRGWAFERARDSLLALQLRSRAIGASSESDIAEQRTVQRQSPPPGTRVRAGHEVRLHVSETAEPSVEGDTSSVEVGGSSVDAVESVEPTPSPESDP